MEESPFAYQPKDIECVLLKVTIDNDTVILRIDNNGLMADHHTGSMVTNLILYGCELDPASLSELTEGIDQPVYYEVAPELNSVEFFINYIDPPVILTCEHVSEQGIDYTYDDLIQKSKRLARLCLAFDYENWRLETKYHRFVGRLKKTVEKEMDRAARKLEFFEQRDPKRASHLVGEIEALNKILLLIQTHEKGE